MLSLFSLKSVGGKGKRAQFFPKGFSTTWFLVGVFEENARLLQWLVFVRQFNAIGPLFCLFVQLLRKLIFRLSEAGERGFVSRTKPQVFCFQK